MTDTPPASSGNFIPPPLKPTDGRYACTGTPMWMCTDCGAAIDYIWGRALHDQFHAYLDRGLRGAP